MSFTASNLVLGPVTGLYVAPFGTTELTDSTVTPDGYAYVPPAPWGDVGGTDGGVTFEADTTYTDLSVDQVIMGVGARLTDLKMSVTTKLAELTLNNLNTSLNSITAQSTGSGYATSDILVTSAATQPTYAALMICGWAPMGATGQAMLRRVIVRKVLSQAKVSMTYDRKGQASYDVTFNAYFVSSSIPPVHITDELA